ncbi:hypothetical protein D9M69_348210 [compost metagenome]
MRDDERFRGPLAEFRRDLVVDEKTKSLDSLPVPVQRTDFRIARLKVNLGEVDADALGPRSVTQLARIGEQSGRDRWKQRQDVGLIMHDHQSGLRWNDGRNLHAHAVRIRGAFHALLMAC